MAEYHVNQTHKNASDTGFGSFNIPFATISKAAEVANAGDTVIVHSGIYRERVAPARGGTEDNYITYKADGAVYIKGSEVLENQWVRTAGNTWTAHIPNEISKPFKTKMSVLTSGRQLTLGQVFIDGERMQELERSSEVASLVNTWCVQDDNIVLNFDGDPNKSLVELSVRDRIFAPHKRGLGYIRVEGFTMEHCANQFPHRFWMSDYPQAGALGCRAGHHWKIINNTVRLAKSIGIDCGYEGKKDLEGNQPAPKTVGHHEIGFNTIDNNGACGLAGMLSHGTSITFNLFTRNNHLWHLAPEHAAIKLHNFVGGEIMGNMFVDNNTHGVWLDNVYHDSKIRDNQMLRCHGNGIFLELGWGPLMVACNRIVDTQEIHKPSDPRGDGIYSHDASGVMVIGNTVIGSKGFGCYHRKSTNRAGAAVSNFNWSMNLFQRNQLGNICLPAEGEYARDNKSDLNMFDKDGDFLINPFGGGDVSVQLGREVRYWHGCPRLTFEEYQKETGWDKSSILI